MQTGAMDATTGENLVLLGHCRTIKRIPPKSKREGGWRLHVSVQNHLLCLTIRSNLL